MKIGCWNLVGWLVMSNVSRDIGQLFPMYTKNDVIRGQANQAKNDVTWGKLTALVCHPTKRVSKAQELTFLSTNIGYLYEEIILIIYLKASSVKILGLFDEVS